MTRRVATTCPYCGVGCGVRATMAGDGAIALDGDEAHPANRGRLCSKGAALAETIGLAGRLLVPEVGGRRATWGAAIAAVADGFAAAVDKYGPDAVAFYVSGQLLTEDYYVANKLMKGFIGSANIDTNSRLCMASSVAGHRRAFGGDIVPGCYEDLDLADLVVLVGSNAAWCHPVLHRRIAARARPPRLVVIDPRRTATCEGADLHLALRPGADAMLFAGLLAHLARHGVVDQDYVATHTEGFAEALGMANDTAPSTADVAAACGLAPDDVAQFFDWFATTGRTVTLYSQGINQSASGTDKVNAILNCHLATGRIGKPGCGPFSLTGQPNAMGGREVGGLANQLAAHMAIEDKGARDLVREFWRAPRMAMRPGLKAVDLFAAVGRGEIKALWVMATNPAVSLPEAEAVRAALAACPFVVVSDCMRHTDTTAFADVLLPAAAWGEKDGTVTNSERRISRQRAFLPPTGEARPDWWIVCEVAKRMGFAEAFDYAGPAAIFREHAALSGHRNDGSRVFDISALAALDDAAYDALAPVQWPVTDAAPGGTPRLFADGRFPAPGGRARFIAVVPRPPVHAPDDAWPLVLNTGRMRDHWHTMTRTGLSPRLSSHAAEPTVDVCPADAAAAGLVDGGLARIASRWGGMLARVRISDAQAPGAVFVPIHWTDRFAPAGRVGPAVNPAVDPISGQPEMKQTPVRIAPAAMAWHAFALSRLPVEPDGADWWVRVAGDGYERFELAGASPPANWDLWARRLLGASDGGGEWIAYRDTTTGLYRFALLREGRLAACLFVAPQPLTTARDWLGALFAAASLSSRDRMGVLAGGPPATAGGADRTVCACFNVGVGRIVAAIRSDGLASVDAVGAALQAGTNCGSCRPEIAALLRRAEAA